MEKTVTMHYSHKHDDIETWLELKVEIARLLTEDLKWLDNPQLEVITDDDLIYVVIDGHQLGEVELGENQWRATLKFHAVFEYSLWDSFESETANLQEIVDKAMTMNRPRVWEWYHSGLGMDLAVIFPEGECKTAALVCAFDQASEDTEGA